MDSHLIAYFAGVIDSDGSITIRRSGNGVTQPTYSERVNVRQVTSQAVQLLYQTFNGSLGMNQSRTSELGRRPMYCWEVANLKAHTCLDAVYPYLCIKREQAEVCFELRRLITQSKLATRAVGRGHVGSASRPLELSNSMEVLYQRLKDLHAHCDGDMILRLPKE